MKSKILFPILLLTIITVITGCSTKEKNGTSSNYTKITGNEAKEMMDSNSDTIILDVRTQEEFQTGHIQGALLIPDSEISKKAEAALPDKDATILVYCRSGRRSALAAEELTSLGYTKIYDFGGIIDWEYEVVTD